VTAAAPPPPPADLPQTTTGLRTAGVGHLTVKQEVRRNLVRRLAAGEPTFPGIVGFADSVIPEVERALIAGHDFVVLGERGQGKTRLLRSLVGLLDEWSPVIAGCEINDHPYEPTCVRCRRLVAEHGDDVAIHWHHRSERYGEKLATPDTSVADLIGDIDPIKVAKGRTLADPETVHYGLLPRTNRGIFAVNELPDLAERIQVSLLNVLEERDIQVRGYRLRLPLDVMVVASANPEDYTNRGRIITPLKDRMGAEIRTHYPIELDDELTLLRQEARLSAIVPDFLLEVVARYARQVRTSPAVDSRSGVSARFAIAGAETIAASAARRSAITGETPAIARPVDLGVIVPTLRGKVEFEVNEEGRELDVLSHLLRQATAEVFRQRLAGIDLEPFVQRFDDGSTVVTGELVDATSLLHEVGPQEGLARIMQRLGIDAAESPGLAAASLEFVLEGLWLTRRLSKSQSGGRTSYAGG